MGDIIFGELCEFLEYSLTDWLDYNNSVFEGLRANYYYINLATELLIVFNSERS